MNRRGFLGLMVGAAVTPLAKVLPAAPVAALDLSSFNAALKEIYTPEVIVALTYSTLTYSTWRFAKLREDEDGKG